jgi:hypothetical protein
MDNVEAVQVPQSLQQLAHKTRHLLFPESTTLLPPLHGLPESSSSNQLHLDEEEVLCLVEGVELDDVLLVESREDFCLLEESVDARVAHSFLLYDLNAKKSTFTA